MRELTGSQLEPGRIYLTRLLPLMKQKRHYCGHDLSQGAAAQFCLTRIYHRMIGSAIVPLARARVECTRKVHALFPPEYCANVDFTDDQKTMTIEGIVHPPPSDIGTVIHPLIL